MVLSMDRWIGKVAVVTGASCGIGAAISEALVEQGLKVAGLARREDRLEAFAKKLSNKKGKLYPIKADIGKEEDVLKAFKWIKDNLGPIHILVNNAGIIGLTNLLEGETEIWKDVININVVGLCITTREAIKDMNENNIDGHIIHINSILGHQVINYPGLNVYPATKHAVTALAETLRLDLMRERSNIKITSISPGPVNTELFPETTKSSEEFQKLVDEKQIIEPDNIADAVVYVLSTPPHVQVQELIVTSVIEPYY